MYWQKTSTERKNMKKKNEIRSTIAVLIALMMLIPIGTIAGETVEENGIIGSSSIGESTTDTIDLESGETEVRDTFLWENPDFEYENYGGSSFIAVGNDSYDYDLHGLVYFDIPHRNGEILYATLSLYTIALSTDEGVNVSVFPVSSPWTEGDGQYDFWTGHSGVKTDANWVNRTTNVSWNNEGGDYQHSPATYMAVKHTDTWYSFNVTEIVRGWLDGQDNYGFMLTGTPVNTSDSALVWFESREYGLGHAPKLRIAYRAEINPEVPSQTTDEDVPISIDLGPVGHETARHISGSMDASNCWPFYTSYQSGRIQMLFFPDEVGAEGKITRIALNRTSMASNNISQFRIYMAHTDRDNLTSTFDDNYMADLIEVLNEEEFDLGASPTD